MTKNLINEVNVKKELTKYYWDNNIELSEEKKRSIEEKFENAEDFSEVGAQITAPINGVANETLTLIKNDPIMDVSGILNNIKKDVDWLYDDIIKEDSFILKFAKAIPLLWLAIDKISGTAENIKFNMKETNEKIQGLFKNFDVSHKSLVKSIELQNKYLKWLNANIDEIIAYRNFIDKKLEEFEEKIVQSSWEEQEKYKNFANAMQNFLSNLNSLIGNLTLWRKRILRRLDAAQNINLVMWPTRWIFEALLSTAVVEAATQKPIEATLKSMNNLWESIDKRNETLTEKTIENSKKTEKMLAKPILNTKKFVNNVEKLKNHFIDIEEYREKMATEAKAEKKEFEKAYETLEDLNVPKPKNHKELMEHLNENNA